MYIEEKNISFNPKIIFKTRNQHITLQKYRSINSFFINLYKKGLIDKKNLDALLIMMQSKYTQSEINRIIKNTLRTQLRKITKSTLMRKEFY